MAMFDNSDIVKVQQATDIVDLVAEHVGLIKKGRDMVGLCPFHDDHSPSMYVSDNKQIFKCFACGAGGDVFKFVQLRENLTFPQAVERLADRASIKLTKVARKPNQQTQPTADPAQMARANAWAMEIFQDNLKDEKKGKAAREYLVQRQIDLQTAKDWKIGLATADNIIIEKANQRKAPLQFLNKAGLIVGGAPSYNDKFKNRLMFPIIDVTARVIGFGGRTLVEDNAKYVNSPATVLFDKSKCLYGLYQARHSIVKTKTAIVTEGYTDVIMAHQAGVTNVVAALGTSFTPEHAKLIRRYAKKIVLVFDSDIAGIEAANRAIQICLKQQIDIKVASVPNGKDPCDFIAENGKEAFEKIIENAVDIMQFKWARLKEKFQADQTLAGQKAAVEEFLNTIATAAQAGHLMAIDMGLLVNRLAGVISLEPKEIKAELILRMKRMQAQSDRNDKNAAVIKNELEAENQNLFAIAQKQILEVLLCEPSLFTQIKKEISVNDFDVPSLKKIAKIAFKAIEQNNDVTVAEILALTESKETGRLIADLAMEGDRKQNFKKNLADSCEILVQRKSKTNIKNQPIKANEYLKQITKNAKKENRRNLGMV